MQQATERPEPTPQRKAAIVSGAVEDHSGGVEVRSIPGFQLDGTIFRQQLFEGHAQLIAQSIHHQVGHPSPTLLEAICDDSVEGVGIRHSAVRRPSARL